jgi:signal transduction histidine kinase
MINHDTIVKEAGHILVVDDNLMNRLSLQRGLEQQGHQVTLAQSGPEALEMLQAQPFDVVLLDIMMPEMDGFAVLERIKGSNALRDLPVIVISALDEMDSVARCIEMGAEDYLPKPFNPILLQARLRASLQKKKLRDLERAYLQQEVMLRQSEKLATLGRLSAGMAHELNNPAAAVQRGAKQLRTEMASLHSAYLQLSALGLSPDQIEALSALDRTSQEYAAQPSSLDSLDRSDREAEIESWLDSQGIPEAWQYPPNLLNLGYDPDRLETLANDLPGDHFPAVIAWLSATYSIYSLIEEMWHGSAHISEIVKALKAYSYMDQAPVQAVDVHEGLDNTLVMLRSKLKTGINIHRDYTSDLPRIEVHGSQLNQVWTNLIDNAIDAMQGHGDLTLRTYVDGNWIVVEVEDQGPGIPKAVQSRIFDPFFTTKPPGQGTGLGLNISHNIVVQNHNGKIGFESAPGRTCFQVKLPVRNGEA